MLKYLCHMRSGR